MEPRHLKAKRYDISLTKNYCITISIQKISSVDKFMLKIQQILGFHKLKSNVIFDQAHPKITESTFSFAEFVPAWKNELFNLFIFEIQWILESRDQAGHKYFWQNDQLFIYVVMYQHAKNGAVTSIYSGEMVGLKIQQSKWLRAFWSTSAGIQ